jgi:hypothetical protein
MDIMGTDFIYCELDTKFLNICKKNSTVGIGKGYGLDGRGLITGSGKKCFCTLQRPKRALGSTQPPIQLVPGALSLGVKWPGRETDNSPLSSGEFKNGAAIHPPLHTSSWRGA